ncbi:MAG: ribosome recycling factor [bacterium]|nr:ribosome recycling factor [bacterium]
MHFPELTKKLQGMIVLFEEKISAIRTGKANPGILQNLEVEAYGTKMKICEVASLSSPDPQMIVVQPWDPTLAAEIEKAVQKSNLNLNPFNDGGVIKVPVPSLSEERRRELAKVIDRELEQERQEVRNIRQDAMRSLDEMKEEKVISEDDRFREREKIEEEVKKTNKVLEEKADKKREEILAI